MRKSKTTTLSKARQFQQNHLKGVPAKEIEQRIIEAIGTKCKYCPTILTLENISLDHIKPLKRKTEKTAKEKATLEDILNTQLICKDCNKLKSDMKEMEYTSFLTWLKKWSDSFPQEKGIKSLMHRILTRIKAGSIRFGGKKCKK
jgi:5-methylcytosine-specific restriction endonuclease McrA